MLGGVRSTSVSSLTRGSRSVTRATAALIACVLLVSIPLSPASAEGEERENVETGEDDSPRAAAGGAGKAPRERAPAGTLTIDGLVLARSKLDDVPFTGRGIQGGAPQPFIPFTARDLDGDDISFGARGTLRGELFDQPFEFSAFYLTPMVLEGTRLNLGSEAGNPANTNAVFHPENDPGADINSTNSENIYALAVRHETQLFGSEINLINPFGVPSLLVGPRAFYFGEEIGATAMEEVDDVPGNGTGTARDQVSVRTDNRLFGLQVGVQGMFDVGHYLRVGGAIKAGLYDNVVTRRRTFFSLNQSVRRQDSTENDDVLAEAVEVNPRIELRLSDDVYLSAAGTFLWLNNVSEATSHFATLSDLNDHDARADGDAFFYGGSLGLTVLLDNATAPAFGGNTSSLSPSAPSGSATSTDVEERIAELEASAATKGNSNVSFEVSGWINRMILAWDDGDSSDAYIVDNVASRSRIEFTGSAKIARGWSAGYILSVGLDDTASNDVDQFNSTGEEQIELRHSAWWVRSNRFGTVSVGHTSTATDDIILHDVGGIMPGAANISTIGGSFIVRHADDPETGEDALIPRTTLDDFAAGASVDTLRRNVVRYDAPRFSGLWGNLDLSAAWGEDDFVDTAANYSLNWNDWKIRSGIGYLHDTTEGSRVGIGTRDREEVKGSASILHIPSGMFATAAYVHREFHGNDPSDQAVFGENTTGLVTPDGSNRPATDYLYTASGLRKRYTSLGDTSIYGEWARVDDAIAGLNEAGLGEVTDSRLEMVGAAICQNIDTAAMDVYLGFRHFSFDTQGVRSFAGTVRDSPEPLTDINFAYAGARMKF